MDGHVARSRRAIVGVAAMALGAAGLVGGLASMAAAHEGTEPEELDENYSCAELAELVGTDQEWIESKHEGFFDAEGEYDLVLSDRGTPDDDSDDAIVTIIVTGPKNFDWVSNVGIDAVFVKGGNAHGSYFYYFDGAELTEDVDYTVPPYGGEQNAISHITFCWDDEGGGTTTTSSSTTSSTVPHDTSTTSSSTTSSTVAPSTSSSSSSTTMAPTTSSSMATTTTVSSGGGLPVTGSNTGLLAALGGGLLLAGGIFLVARRQLWSRPG
jgi:LPXTG-motif cell wall-anchored protein